QVEVPILGDVDYEDDETFYVNVVGLSGATPGKVQGQATITNDDDLLAPVVAAAFAPETIQLGGTTALTMTISNPNPQVALTGVSVGPAPLPADLTSSGASTTCTSGVPTSFAGNFGLSGATVPAGDSCTVRIDLSANLGAPGERSFTTGLPAAEGP